MSSSAFGWESLLSTDMVEHSLKAALFTTYDRADERLLSEHLLPLLLNLSREPQAEGPDQQYFLVELNERLKQLHGKLVIVSSTVREEPAESQEGESQSYPWIWRSIRSLTVGSRAKAVQHAKLWLLHWKADDNGSEYLEIVVSSANLTHAAFKGQLQGAWRACMKLHSQRSQARLRDWGILPEFVRKLAESAGDEERLTPFIELLARAERPEGVIFVASVPGTHHPRELRATPWGAAGLRGLAPPGRGVVSISILTPFVGFWRSGAISRWCGSFGGLSTSLRLIWIDKHHPWARRWVLPAATLDSLTGAGARIVHLRQDPDQYEANDLFHAEHRPADDRWSHAKVYLFKRGNSRRLLVTSANFSPAAWGDESPNGDLIIENFELGVCIEQGSWPFDDLDIFDDVKSVATVSDLTNRGIALIAWARAAWDGTSVHVDCRCESSDVLTGEVIGGGEPISIDIWTVNSGTMLRSACVPWVDAEQPPALVKLVCGNQTMSIAVFDERTLGERENSMPPDVDKELGQVIRDQLLFEQYGGQFADDVENPDVARSGLDDIEPGTEAIYKETLEEKEALEEAAAVHIESYAVPAFVAARRHLAVVDNWADRLKREAIGSTGNCEQQMLERDGRLLIEAFQRQATRDEKQSPSHAIGARLAAEELKLRLEHLVS